MGIRHRYATLEEGRKRGGRDWLLEEGGRAGAHQIPFFELETLMKSTGVVVIMSPSPREHGPVVIIGGGPSGMTAAVALARLGHHVDLVERSDRLGGRLSHLAKLSPDLNSAQDEAHKLTRELEEERNVRVRLSRSVVSVTSNNGSYRVELDDGEVLDSDAVIIATGLEEVPPEIVPEFGHGMDGVVSSIELEEMMRIGRVVGRGGSPPTSVVFIQCVGSRTERRGVPYCSALCCGNSIKNALELKRSYPNMNVTVLYIDIRTSLPGQEALYREARRAGVRFVRGQPSLVMEKKGKLMVCGENTLLRELYEEPADLVVLAIGLRQSPDQLLFMDELEIRQGTSGFPSGEGTAVEGIFLCGSAKRPMDLLSTVMDARSCALEAHLYLKKLGER